LIGIGLDSTFSPSIPENQYYTKSLFLRENTFQSELNIGLYSCKQRYGFSGLLLASALIAGVPAYLKPLLSYVAETVLGNLKSDSEIMLEVNGDLKALIEAFKKEFENQYYFTKIGSEKSDK
jgi:hypothetical protein